MTNLENDPIRVLLVDDDPVVLRSLKRILIEEDLEVETSTCAAEANAFLSHCQIDVVVSDHNMPGRKGLEFLTEIRESRPNLITMLLSGEVKGIKVAEDWAAEIGLHAVFTKPFDGEIIASEIRSKVTQQRKEIANSAIEQTAEAS